MKKIVDIILIVLCFIPLFLLALVNSLVLWIGDWTGLFGLLARWKIHRSYEPKLRRVDPGRVTARKDRLVAALAAQGYVSGAASELIRNGVIGIRAIDPKNRNSQTGNPKCAYYLEGTPFEIGRFVGRLAEAETSAMSDHYVDNVVFDFAGLGPVKGPWGAIIADFVYLISRWNDSILPKDLRAEIFGLWAGASEVNPKTKVNIRHLYVLNYGIDVVLAYVYAGFEPVLNFLGIKVADFKPPIGCNAFTARPSVTKDGHLLFGRNFMFPTCGVFGDVAAHGVFIPVSDGRWFERSKRPMPKRMVSLFSPGMVGSVVAINDSGVSMGLDMVAGRRCNWRRVGLNSLVMVRYAVGQADSAAALVETVARAPRGVTWLYPFADPERGGVIEAGDRRRSSSWLRYTPRSLRKLLPKKQFIKDHQSAPSHLGLFARYDDYQYPEAYLEFNQALFEHFGKAMPPPEAWGPTGFLNQTPHGLAMPDGYYFAPLRIGRPEVMVACNHYIVPEMRLSAMNEWTSLVPAEGHNFDDFQWRCDRLNYRLANYLGSAAKAKPLTIEQAWDCVNFLRPYDGTKKAEYWFYYAQKPDGTVLPPDAISVEGSISLIDCTDLTITSLYGMFVDQPVTLAFKPILAAIDEPHS